MPSKRSRIGGSRVANSRAVMSLPEEAGKGPPEACCCPSPEGLPAAVFTRNGRRSVSGILFDKGAAGTGWLSLSLRNRFLKNDAMIFKESRGLKQNNFRHAPPAIQRMQICVSSSGLSTLIRFPRIRTIDSHRQRPEFIAPTVIGTQRQIAGLRINFVQHFRTQTV